MAESSAGNTGWKRRSLRKRDSATKAAPAPEPEPRRLSTFFGDGGEVDGRLVVKTSIEIDGEFRGAIESEQSVTVGPEATLQGNLRARSVRIRGAVVGDVEASREIVIESTGKLHGAVITPSLVVERGAFFTGQTRMYRPEIAARMEPELPDGADAPDAAPGAIATD